VSKKSYKAVFFDLDHTLWDYDRNAKITLKLLYEKYLEGKNGMNSDVFLEEFIRINDIVWEKFDRGEISREDIRVIRFIELLELFGINDQSLAETISHEYMKLGPFQSHLMPNARELLEMLGEKYSLFVLTNGFEDIQQQKLLSAGIAGYFKEIITSERVGNKKPAPDIFEYAVKAAGCLKEETIMVGDNLLTDMAGSIGYGIDCVFLNTKNKVHQVPVTHEIKDLGELFGIL